MELDNFTIDLVSNGSMDIFPDNTLSKFENQIDPALELDGDWEVALTEIYFPVKFDIDLPDDILVEFHTEYKNFTKWDNLQLKSASKNWKRYGHDVGSVIISPKDPIDITIKKLNDAMESNVRKYEFELDYVVKYPKFTRENGKTIFSTGLHTHEKFADNVTHFLTNFSAVDQVKVKFKQTFNIDIDDGFIMKDSVTEISPSHFEDSYYKDVLFGELHAHRKMGTAEDWKYMNTVHKILVSKFHNEAALKYLGFNPSVDEFMSVFNDQKQKVDVTTPLYHQYNVNIMYIYTDIIRDHTVGGIKSPVLRTIPLTTGIYKGIGYCTFEHRIYYPIRKNHIENIAILCLDDTGDQVKFANLGRVSISLDFRKKKLI